MIKQISIGQLSPGMYIADLNNQWIPRTNAARNGLVKNQLVIDKIRALGVTELFIDTDKGVNCLQGQAADAVKQLQANQFNSLSLQSGAMGAKPGGRPATVTQERDRAEQRYGAAKQLVGGIIEDIKTGKGVNADAVDNSASDLIESLNANENALTCLSFIRTKDQYLLEHSVNVALLLGIFAKAQRMDDSTIHQLVAGGLLHDIGKVLVPAEILNKSGKLEPDEWDEMKRHVTYGEQILAVTAGLSDITRSICSIHHERLDGSGYPRNLPASEISLYGRMAAICDVYDAVTADRVYHSGMEPKQALKKLIEWSIFHLDKDLVYDFIRCLSAYPVGTLVELSHERAAVIIGANRRQPKQPMVRLFYNTKEQRTVTPEIIDLASKNCAYAIINTLDRRQLGIDIRPFL